MPTGICILKQSPWYGALNFIFTMQLLQENPETRFQWTFIWKTVADISLNNKWSHQHTDRSPQRMPSKLVLMGTIRQLEQAGVWSDFQPFGLVELAGWLDCENLQARRFQKKLLRYCNILQPTPPKPPGSASVNFSAFHELLNDQRLQRLSNVIKVPIKSLWTSACLLSWQGNLQSRSKGLGLI